MNQTIRSLSYCIDRAPFPVFHYCERRPSRPGAWQQGNRTGKYFVPYQPRWPLVEWHYRPFSGHPIMVYSCCLFLRIHGSPMVHFELVLISSQYIEATLNWYAFFGINSPIQIEERKSFRNVKLFCNFFIGRYDFNCLFGLIKLEPTVSKESIQR